MCIPLKPVFSRHKGDGVQITDEPTGNLDSQSSRDVMELLCKASRYYQQTVLMITHNMNLTVSADRVFCVADGELTELVSPSHAKDSGLSESQGGQDKEPAGIDGREKGGAAE